MAYHYECRGSVLHTGLRLDEGDYAFDYDPAFDVDGFVWTNDRHMPPRPITLFLRLDKSGQFIPVYLTFFDYDADRKKFQFGLSLSDHQPDDPNNLFAKR